MLQNQYNKPLDEYMEYVTSEEKYLKWITIFSKNDKAYYDPECKSPVHSGDLYNLFQSGKLRIFEIDVTGEVPWIPTSIVFDAQDNTCIFGTIGDKGPISAASAEYTPQK